MNTYQVCDDELEVRTFASDRRRDRRYEVSLKLQWTITHRRRLLDWGTGTTVDLSSSGILFQTDRQIPVDCFVELSICWPVLLNDSQPMQLIVMGRVTRLSGGCVAIQMLQHGFRTVDAANAVQS